MASEGVGVVIASLEQKFSDLSNFVREDDIRASSSTFIKDPKIFQSKGCRPN